MSLKGGTINNENVTGNGCKRGFVYGLNEVKEPKRIVTSTVKIYGVSGAGCSCKN